MISPSSLFCHTCGAANQLHATFCINCGQPLQKTTHLSTGLLSPDTMLKNRYRILHEIGQGGYGAVYKAIDTELANRAVAVKEMSQHGLSPQEIQEATEAFKQEVFILARLKHPNLPSIYDYFTEGGRWYVVMDFIEGETLEDYLAKGGNGRPAGAPLPLDEVIHIGLQLCTVLDYLHRRQPPIIFRDLKPANVMRTPEGQLYLIDFGIARIFKQGKARDTTALGSPGFAAPEQYGKTQTTPRSDIYSLGATLHQLLTGNDPSQMPFSFVPPHLPAYPDLSRLVMQMLDPHPQNRPPSIASVKQALQAMSGSRLPGLEARYLPPPGPPVTMSGPPSSYREPIVQPYPPQYERGQAQQMEMYPRPLPPKRGPSRRRVLIGLAGFAALIVGVGAGSYLFRHEHDMAEPDISFDAKPTFVPASSSSLFPTSLPDTASLSIAWSPDRRHIALASAKGFVQVIDATSKQVIFTYLEHKAEVSAVAWSPDGRLVASASYDQTVQVWDASVGKLFATYTMHTSPVLAVAWSPDGKRIASGSYDGQVHVWDASSSNASYQYHGHTDQVTSVAWSPDGKRIASGSADKTVMIHTDQTFLTYAGHTDVVESVAWSPDGTKIVSGSNDRTAQVWDALTATPHLTYSQHRDQVWSVAWSPSGGLIASGSLDQTAQVWSAVDASKIMSYADNSQVLAVAWSPDSQQIAFSDTDGEVKIQNVTT